MAETVDKLRSLARGPVSERMLELAGLITTRFLLRGVDLMVVGDLAFASYSDSPTVRGELEFAPLAGVLAPRLLQDVMGREMGAEGSVAQWKLLGFSIRFHFESGLTLQNLCREIWTGHGLVRLRPAEEITAERVLAAVYPRANLEARGEALTLMTRALIDAFDMDWIALRELCHQPAYRVGEEMTQLRIEAKQGADARGLIPDQIGKVWSNRPDLASDGTVYLPS